MRRKQRQHEELRSFLPIGARRERLVELTQQAVKMKAKRNLQPGERSADMFPEAVSKFLLFAMLTAGD